MRSFWLVASLVIFGVIGYCAPAAAQTDPSAMVDLTDPVQLDSLYGDKAGNACDAGVAAYLSGAKLDTTWDTSDSKFDSYVPHVPQPGILVLESQHLFLKQPSGYYMRFAIKCWYDTQTDKVTGYQVLSLVPLPSSMQT